MQNFKLSNEYKSKLVKKDLFKRVLTNSIGVVLLLLAVVYGNQIISIQIALYSGIPILIGGAFFWHKRFSNSLEEPELLLNEDRITVKGFATEEVRTIEFLNLSKITNQKEAIKLVTHSGNEVLISKNFDDYELIQKTLMEWVENNNKA